MNRPTGGITKKSAALSLLSGVILSLLAMSCDPNAKAPVVKNPSGLIDGTPTNPNILNNLVPKINNPIETYDLLNTDVPQTKK